jgi:two-component system cell cycle response regulator
MEYGSVSTRSPDRPTGRHPTDTDPTDTPTRPTSTRDGATVNATATGSAARAALPALAVGALGLIVGVAGFAFDQAWLGLPAGALALVAAVLASGTARRLDEQGALQRLVEDELRAVRDEARSNETRLQAEVEALTAEVDEPFAEDGDDDTDGEPVLGIELLVDPGTGLFSEQFFAVTLDTRIAAARRHLRPVALVLLDVVRGLPQAEIPQAAESTVVAHAIRTTLREADLASRLRTGNFALLLEDTPENGAIWTVERIRRCLANEHPELTLWAGVACYPAHAFSAGELLNASHQALLAAREWRQDRIEVAATAVD